MDDYRPLAALLAGVIVRAVWSWEKRREAERITHPERFFAPPPTGPEWVRKDPPTWLGGSVGWPARLGAWWGRLRAIGRR